MTDRYDVMVVREGKDGGKAWFTKVGTMWPAKNGEGFTIVLDANPIDGKLIVRVPLPKRDEDQRGNDGGRGAGRGSNAQRGGDDDDGF